MRTDIACLVVHHRRPAALVRTVGAIVEAGVSAEAILVVDNSEDSRYCDSLTTGLPQACQLISIPNRGYGNAINCGLDWMASAGLDRQFTLVASHEAVPAPDAIERLSAALLARTNAGVAGPTVYVGAWPEDGGRIWSTGGRISRLSGRPIHTAASPSDSPLPVPREWLDGCLTLYRTDVLRHSKFREDYFLYFEETDIHARIRRSGHVILWVPESRAIQESSGIPPYLLARNSRLYLRANGRGLQAVFTPTYLAARYILRSLLRVHNPRIRSLCAGLRDGRLHAALPPGSEYDAYNSLTKRLHV